MKQKYFTSRFIKESVHFLLLAFFLFAGRSAIADWNRIPSGSMEPTLYIGDLILVNKLAYDLKIPFTTTHLATWSEPKRGDIVVFYKPQDGQRLIKRVVGTPGDTIAMKNNYLIINGQVTHYQLHNQSLPYILPADEQQQAIVATEYLDKKEHTVMALPSRNALRTFGPVKVPKGQFLMLGDNRDYSADSRYFGFVPRKQIIGKAERVLLSWDKENLYKPRFKRFFQQLI
ncbi:signal peptidase I (lepB-1) [Legionella busanensis]|uniref:Signal peptidase I n=1 Tax=Legionella busanensis TaxID=190655 RepID=A0A378JJS7_9GAMM|nr:signal peptidase I [Legionella busanensis]STX51424.1 signal peptidase I (lepB-1) [Legionella busanensis]